MINALPERRYNVQFSAGESPHKPQPIENTMLEQFPIISTYDSERMSAALTKTYGVRVFDLKKGHIGFYGQANHVQFGSVGLSYCSYGARVQVDFPEADYVRQQICLAGSSTTAMADRQVAITPRQSCVVPSGVDIKTDFGEGYEQLVLRIDEKALESKVTTMLGYRPRGRLEFDSVVDFDKGKADRFQRLMLFLAKELGGAIGPLPPAILNEFEQIVIATFLHANRHTFSELLELPTMRIAPWQVHRVEDYIETNWNRAITIEELSNVTQASTRSIFKAFKESRGYSPMSFLKKVRLKHARRMLCTTDERCSVSQIALACGFLNLGHFSKDYREAFGELPSATLGKSRQGRSTSRS